MTKRDQNEVLFERAQKTIPGGVNSPVRAFRQVGGIPRFVSKAKGPYFWDAEDKRYIDLIMSWGPMIVGHAHPEVVEAVQRAAETSFSYGAPTEGEIELAERICALVPSIEQVRARCRRNQPGYVHLLAWVGRVRLEWSRQRLQRIRWQAVAPERPWVQQPDGG